MLPKKLRLTRQTFPDTRGLKRASSTHFSISYGDSVLGKKAGVAVVISKKVARLAVSRHLLKRRILSIARTFPIKDHIIVVHSRPGASDISFTELKSELISLLGSILGKN